MCLPEPVTVRRDGSEKEIELLLDSGGPAAQVRGLKRMAARAVRILMRVMSQCAALHRKTRGYSCWSTTSGAIVAARIAGTSVASTAAPPSTAAVPTYVPASHGLISNRRPVNSRQPVRPRLGY
jgi:hypothetical protein